MTTLRAPIRAGAAVRRHLRAYLDLNDIPWTEHKGWLESNFIVTLTSQQQAAHLEDFIRNLNGDI